MIFVPAFLNWEKRRNIFFNGCNNVRDSKKNAKTAKTLKNRLTNP